MKDQRDSELKLRLQVLLDMFEAIHWLWSIESLFDESFFKSSLEKILTDESGRLWTTVCL